MNGCATSGIAATICGDLVLNGYSDWYLPSMDELNKLYLNIGQGAPSPNTNVGGFADKNYWSSTEIDNASARVQNFNSGIHGGPYYKHYTAYVRAVRAF